MELESSNDFGNPDSRSRINVLDERFDGTRSGITLDLQCDPTSSTQPVS